MNLWDLWQTKLIPAARNLNILPKILNCLVIQQHWFVRHSGNVKQTEITSKTTGGKQSTTKRLQRKREIQIEAQLTDTDELGAFVQYPDEGTDATDHLRPSALQNTKWHQTLHGTAAC